MPGYQDRSRPSAERAALLLEELTIEEKCAQLVGVFPWVLITPDGGAAEGSAPLLDAPPGHISGLAVDDHRTLTDLVGAIQRLMLERTRARIPALIHAEGLNGFVTGGHTVFPSPTGLASTWSPDLVQEMASVIRAQMLSAGVRQALSPVLDVAVDPRWGRVHETYGEDPYLVAAMGVAYVRGLQGEDLNDGIIATAKHFLAYGLPETGLNLSAAELGSRRLRDVYAYPFEAAIRLAGMRSVMNSYADVDSVPVGASRAVLTDLLRGELGFSGFVTSDYTTTQHFVERQKVAENPEEAGRLAVAAGLDVELPNEYAYGSVLAAQVRQGAVRMADVDVLVERVLRAKFDLGLFEDPFPRTTIDLDATAGTGDALSGELARRSVVLLRNEAALPLEAGVRVAVVGPHADAVAYQFPTYTYPAWREMVTRMHSGALGNAVGVPPAAAHWHDALFPHEELDTLLRSRYSATSLADELRARCDVVGVEEGTTPLTGDATPESLDRARALVDAADVVVLALGGASLWFNGPRTEGEGSDSADISLPRGQVALAEAVAAAAATAGKPVIVVLVQGRGYALPSAVLDAPAVVVAPYGGTYGPRAVAQALLGEVNPSGKLPYSIPRHTGQLPVYHYQRNGTGQRQPRPPAIEEHYLDLPSSPAFPFGFGLSYTRFELGDLQHDETVSTDGSLRVSARVRNAGDRSGAAVVQLYLQLRATGITRPSQQLAGLARVDLPPGAQALVSFDVDASQLRFTGLDDHSIVVPGRASLFVGLHSDDRALAGDVEVTGSARSVPGRERAFQSSAQVQPAG
jgi:beta-glucosidase